MQNKKIQAAFQTVRALIQAEAPEKQPSAVSSWLLSALQQLDQAETCCEHYEAAVTAEAQAVLHHQNIARIQAESLEQVRQTRADLAARTEQR